MKLIKVGSELIWLWLPSIEPESRELVGLKISKKQNMFVAACFLSGKLESKENIQFLRMEVHGIHRPADS